MIGTYLLIFLVPSVCGLLPGLYCGERDCYDVLNATREMTKGDLAKPCRKLLAKFHPDKWKEETLRDEDIRKEYDYLLDNPSEVYRHYWYYYRRRVAPKVDVRLVILGTIAAISIVQYISARHKFSEAMSYLLTAPKYRMRASEIAKQRGLLPIPGNRKGARKRNKEEIKREEEAIIRCIIEENIDIKGGYKKPSVLNILAVQIVLFPYHVFNYIRWWARWVWRFWINKEEYGEQEKLYLIRKNLKLGQDQFDSLESQEIEKMLREELWISEKFTVWKEKRTEEEKRKLADNNQAKRYRRFMKNQGPGQISFVDE